MTVPETTGSCTVRQPISYTTTSTAVMADYDDEQHRREEAERRERRKVRDGEC